MGKVEIHGVIASPFVRTVMVVCESVGVPYELKILDPINKSPEFKKLNPQQAIPVLVDDGFVLAESHAIIRYLADKYAKNDALYPKDLHSRAVINARLDFILGLLPKLGPVFIPVLMGGEEKISEEGIQTVNDLVSILEDFLTRNKWIAGPGMTIADISLANIIVIFSEFQINLAQFPKTENWLQEVKKNEIFNKIYEAGIISWRERYKIGKKN